MTDGDATVTGGGVVAAGVGVGGEEATGVDATTFDVTVFGAGTAATFVAEGGVVGATVGGFEGVVGAGPAATCVGADTAAVGAASDDAGWDAATDCADARGIGFPSTVPTVACAAGRCNGSARSDCSSSKSAAALVRAQPAAYTVNTAAEPSAARLLFSH
jgi:hypothetical protein